MVKKGYRELDDEEKANCEKSILHLQKQNTWLDWVVADRELKVQKGLQANFERQMNDCRTEASQARAELERNNQTIALLKEQLVMGVKSKKDKEFDGVDE